MCTLFKATIICRVNLTDQAVFSDSQKIIFSDKRAVNGQALVS